MISKNQVNKIDLTGFELDWLNKSVYFRVFPWLNSLEAGVKKKFSSFKNKNSCLLSCNPWFNS